MSKILIALSLLGLVISGCGQATSDPITVTQQFAYTAVGDDGIMNQANVIQIRMALSEDSLINNWNVCTIAVEAPSAMPLVRDTVTADILITTGPTYYFAIKTADEVLNWSLISNIAAKTYPDNTAPSAIGDFDVL